ncbi:class I SAM-dependent RNA methyltransferase [Myceligenerans pegani]|uniref:Class I SAM-dependent RNA methyltransferase n=1 Tax=Myceligenerans pegani TaxID=2776917 RepID=A0ABR9MZL7_9MICO|nr:TRAM domain-containing protein [Myceligenerans sp. TRM 65318]MBE1876839.1 class I SAM-dependent RNA methyltransferase [Myceligenerans sp. TRM 65318]MBE3019110.1 class I SAM-dependent RNA methyltransferase [Myceligenerans sp. TRM 65318]
MTTRPSRPRTRPGRPPRGREPRVSDVPGVGELLELEIGPVAHGGHCVARHEGRVVFVRHTLPGERVRARVTSTGSRFWRADAVEVLEPSPDRVDPAWPAAGPGGVGGGELSHVALPAQRRWKADVVAGQLRRIARYDGPLLDGLTVEAAPGDDAAAGLGYRTRIDLVADDGGRLGMHRFRSHDVVALDALPAGMPLATPGVAELAAAEDVFERRWKPGTRVELVAPAGPDGADATATGGEAQGLVLVDGEPWHRGRVDSRPNARRAVKESMTVRLPGAEDATTFTYRVSAAGFWQVHRAAPGLLAQAVLDAAGDVAGATVLDLYSGAGLFTLPLAAAVREGGTVVAVEGDDGAVRDARRNAHGLDQVRLLTGDVAEVLAGRGEAPARGRAAEPDAGGGPVHGRADVVVLDPPRAGAKRDVVAAIADRDPARVVYVACDPAALARDVGYFAQAGYHLTSLRAFDVFPHTHHVEAVAVLERA